MSLAAHPLALKPHEVNRFAHLGLIRWRTEPQEIQRATKDGVRVKLTSREHAAAWRSRNLELARQRSRDCMRRLRENRARK